MAVLTNANPFISIVIVNHNGILFIETCIKSVLNTDFPQFEVILIDNHSIDGSLELIKEKFANNRRLKIIENKINLGPVKARNIGIASSIGNYVAFLDNDTEVDKDWLKELIRVFDSDKAIGAAQCKILLFDKKTIDTCGHYLSISGFPYEVGAGEPDKGQYNELVNIFGARSAAMFIRRDILEAIGYFDEDYFIYGEETDLSWRVWLNNYKVVYVPGSVVYHKKGGSLNEKSRQRVFYEGAKNCTKTLIKNLELKNLVFFLTLHVSAWSLLGIIFVLKARIKDALAIIKGLLWNIHNFKHTLMDRALVQERRILKDSLILPIIMGDYDMVMLIKKGIGWTSHV